MEKTCLIAGKSGALLADIVRRCSAAGRLPLVARSGQADLPGIPPGAPAPVSWNRRSALSARSLLLHAQTVCGGISDVVVVYSPVQETTPFHIGAVVSIEDRVDAEIKGYQFLLRELVTVLQAQGSGRLVLAVLDHLNEPPAPLEAAALASFMALARSIQEFYQNQRLAVQLCYSSDVDTDGYAGLITACLDAPRPRRPKSGWQTFPTRARIRSVVP